MGMKEFIYKPPSDPLEIIFQDDHLLIVDKPSGLLSVPGKAIEHADCLETRLKSQFPDALSVHRLDMDTSGIMVFACNKVAQRHLGLQFEKRIIEKTYMARVDGVVANDSGEINLPLIGDWPNRPLQMVDHERGKPAMTQWRVLVREQNATRIELSPKTGRSHQLRVHMKAIGHTILGDAFYGTAVQVAAADRLQLHAQCLALRHPIGGAWHRFAASVPF